jgi:PHD/YefM family antitoxin component YafN of YafNO toxin-antitoxin module
MKRITITDATKDLASVLALAEEGPVVLLAPNGKEYVLAPADDFDHEVEQLRQSAAFQHFLDERSAHKRPRRALADVAREIEAEIAQQKEQ